MAPSLWPKGQEEGARQVPQREASFRRPWRRPPPAPGCAHFNQSDWIRVRATLIMSEVTQALWQGLQGAWPSLLRRPH